VSDFTAGIFRLRAGNSSTLDSAHEVVCAKHPFCRLDPWFWSTINQQAEAFLKDQITIGHTLLIAKPPASQRQEAFAAAFHGVRTSDGNTQVMIPDVDPALD
jgi:hypothetical protein